VALINCSECAAQISSNAERCPHCGNPLAARADVVSGRQVRTIEKTAKRYKGLSVLFTLAALAGIVTAIASLSRTPYSFWISRRRASHGVRRRVSDSDENRGMVASRMNRTSARI